MYEFAIRDLDLKERPREKLMSIGAENLSDAELISIIIRSGGKEESVVDLSRKLLKKSGGIRNLLDLSMEQLLEFKNMGRAKAAAISALNEICLRVNIQDFDRKRIK